MATKALPTFNDTESVETDFRFKTFGEMVEAFGRTRATSLLVKARSHRQGNGKAPAVTVEDIEVTRVFLGLKPAEAGSRGGRESGKALKVFKAFANRDATSRNAVKKFLDSLDREIKEAPGKLQQR